MDSTNTLRSNLLAKHHASLHLRFFEKDPSLSFFKVSILSPQNPQKKFIPFRNITCTKPDCLYDLDTLIEKCQSLSYRSLNGFVCEKCHLRVEIKNLFHDRYLHNIINSLWGPNDTPNKSMCPCIVIKRDGTWQPSFPEKKVNYLETLLSGMDRSKSRRSRIGKAGSTKSTWKEEEESILNVRDDWENFGNPPHLCEFNYEEYENFLSAFEGSVMDDKAMLERGSNIISKRDVWKLENDEIVTSNTVGMFVGYLNMLQKAYKQVYNSKNNNRCYTIALSVLSFEKFTKATKYNFISSNTEYKENTEDFLDDYDRLTLILYYDERWIVAVLDLVEGNLLLADFLSEELSKAKTQEMLDVLKQILRLEFYRPYRTAKLADVPKIKFLSDCGVYSLSFVYKCMNNASTETLSVKFWEKELFKKQVVWLFLKLKDVNVANKPATPKKELRISSKLSSNSNQSYKQLLRLPSCESIQLESGAKLRARSYNHIPDEKPEGPRIKIFSQSNQKSIPKENLSIDLRLSDDKQPQSLNISPRDYVPHVPRIRERSNNTPSDKAGPYQLGRVKDSVVYNKLRLAENNAANLSFNGFDPGLSAISRTESVKNNTRIRNVASMTNLNTSITSQVPESINHSIKRNELADILKNFKKDVIHTIRNETEKSHNEQKCGSRLVRKLNFKSEDETDRNNTSILPSLQQSKNTGSYKSLSSMLSGKLPDPNRFLPRKDTASIDVMGLEDSDIDDKKESSEEEDDEQSRSIILFAFQEGSRPPSRTKEQIEEPKIKEQPREKIDDTRRKETDKTGRRKPVARSLNNLDKERHPKKPQLASLEDADLFQYAGKNF